MRLGRWCLLMVSVAAAACTSTIGPVFPSVQVVVVLDSLDNTLRIIPVDSPEVMHTVAIGVGLFSKHTLALSGRIAAIGGGGAVAFLDLTGQTSYCSAGVATGPVASLAFADDGDLYGAIPSTNHVQHWTPALGGADCPGGDVVIRGGPLAFANARTSQLVVVAANMNCNPLVSSCPELPSWLTTPSGQPAGNTPLPAGKDSIGLSSPGNAQGAVLASDGFLYVINAGNGQQANARLSQVDPVQFVEQSVYNGFGTLPQYIATDGERVFVASAAEGLMVYNTRTKQVERDRSTAIPLFGLAPRGLVTDDLGRVYALIAGSCTTAAAGGIRIFGSDLVYKRGVTVGHCPVAIGVTDIPAALYHFDN